MKKTDKKKTKIHKIKDNFKKGIKVKNKRHKPVKNTKDTKDIKIQMIKMI